MAGCSLESDLLQGTLSRRGVMHWRFQVPRLTFPRLVSDGSAGMDSVGEPSRIILIRRWLRLRVDMMLALGGRGG